MTQRLLSCLVLLSLALSLTAIAPAVEVPALMAGEMEKDFSGVRLLHSDADGALLEMVAQEYELTPARLDGHNYSRMHVPGAGARKEPGKPELPVFGALLIVPPGAEISLHVIEADAKTLTSKHILAPSPSPASLEDALMPGDMYYPPYRLSPNGFYPDASASLDEVAWVREYRIARLSFYPFQYDSSYGSLQWNRRVLVEVRFDGSGAQGSPVGGYHDTLLPDPFEPLLRQALNYDSASTWAADTLSLAPAAAAFIDPSTKPRLRIAVEENGIYRLAYDALVAEGVPTAKLAEAISLTNQGYPVAYWMEEAGVKDGKLDPGEALYFYGQAFSGETLSGLYADEDDHWMSYYVQDTQGNYELWRPQMTAEMVEKYTNENVYWLRFGEGDGLMMPSQDARPNNAPKRTDYRETLRFEESLIWRTDFRVEEDTWYWKAISASSSTPATARFLFSMTGVAPDTDTATLRGEVYAHSYNNTASPDHHNQVYINDPTHTSPVLDLTWDGQSILAYETTFDQSLLNEGNNILDFVVHRTPSMQYESQFFNWFEISYRRRLDAVNNGLLFEGEDTGLWQYSLQGFTASPVRVIDITNPRSPVWLTNIIYASGAVSFEIHHSDDARFFAGIARDVSGDALEYYTPPDLSSPADYLIITHADFLAAAQPLADRREAQGLSTLVVDVQDLYNQFNFGIFHPLAIKNFLRWTFSAWDRPPTYALLIGDGHWNFHFYDFLPDEYVFTTVYMPPNLSWVDPWQGEVDSVALLANVVGDDVLPDLYISRIPVNSPEQLTAVVDKIAAYEDAPMQDWHRNAAFIADNVPDAAGNFLAISEEIIATELPTFYTPQRLYYNDYLESQPGACTTGGTRPCPALTAAILETLGGPGQQVISETYGVSTTLGITGTNGVTGTLLLSYVGHADTVRWTKESVFTRQDIPLLENGDRLPVALSMTCLDGYWTYPGSSGLIEVFLRTPEKGIVGAFSPTGLGVATGHDVLHRGFLRSLFDAGDWRLGAAAEYARLLLYQTGSDVDLLKTFTVFGDPAMRIRSPYSLDVSPDSQDSEAPPGTSLLYNIQVSNLGVVLDSVQVSLTGGDWNEEVILAPGEIPAKGTAYVTIRARVPPGVPKGAESTALVTITSRGDRSVEEVITLTTRAGDSRVYLPITMGRR